MWSHSSNTSKRGWGPNHFVQLIPADAVGIREAEWATVKGKTKKGKRKAEMPKVEMSPSKKKPSATSLPPQPSVPQRGSPQGRSGISGIKKSHLVEDPTIADNDKHVGVCDVRIVYLITYSRADLTKIPTREAFAEAVKGACLYSAGHPDLQECNPPKTEKANAGKKRKASGKNHGGERKGRKLGLSVYDVVQFVQSKNITSHLKLMSVAATQNCKGKKDLGEFICNRGGKAVDECLAMANELGTAEEKFKRSQKSQIQLLEEAAENDCIEGCNGKWLQAKPRLHASLKIITLKWPCLAKLFTPC
ncbi:hypothetical protein ACROYT_G015089 [Oculina patagonica]